MKYALIVALALLGACRREEAPVQSHPPAAEPPTVVQRAPVETDRPRYKLQEGPFGPEVAIVSTFTAPATHDVYILNCNDAFSVGLQQQVGDRWEHVWAPGMNACMSPPIVVRAGATRQATIVVDSGADAAVTSRQSELKIDSGTYRVIWHGLLSSFDANASPPGPDLPVEQRVSAPIFIEAATPHDPAQPSPARPPAEVQSVMPPHGAVVEADARVRVQLATVYGEPHLYVDREWVAAARRGNVLEFAPPRRWSPGRHSIRVLYQRDQKTTLWYAWSFVVK